MNPSAAETVFTGHYEDPGCSVGLTRAAAALLAECGKNGMYEVAYLCIGTDRATGDCLGPLVGTRLQTLLPGVPVFGTLEHPVHALNLQEALFQIQRSYAFPKILAIDACLGGSKQVGSISLKRGALRPGAALKKNLPEVGDCHLTGVVNVSGFCDHLVLQNTRLYVVHKMADIMARSLFMAHQYCRNNKYQLSHPFGHPSNLPSSADFVIPGN